MKKQCEERKKQTHNIRNINLKIGTGTSTKHNAVSQRLLLSLHLPVGYGFQGQWHGGITELKWVHVPLLFDRQEPAARACAASARSFRDGTLNSTDDASSCELSHETDRYKQRATAAMQNLTDIFAKQFPVCAEKALAEGAQQPWAQKGETAESSLCSRYQTQQLL